MISVKSNPIFGYVLLLAGIFIAGTNLLILNGNNPMMIFIGISQIVLGIGHITTKWITYEDNELKSYGIFNIASQSYIIKSKEDLSFEKNKIILTDKGKTIRFSPLSHNKKDWEELVNHLSDNSDEIFMKEIHEIN